MYYLQSDVLGEAIIRVNEDGSTTHIPLSEDNADYAAYQEWVAEGNTPEPWPPAE
jgi:hypothetical protein